MGTFERWIRDCQQKIGDIYRRLRDLSDQLKAVRQAQMAQGQQQPTSGGDGGDADGPTYFWCTLGAPLPANSSVGGVTVTSATKNYSGCTIKNETLSDLQAGYVIVARNSSTSFSAVTQPCKPQ